MVKHISGIGLSKHVNSDVEIITEPGFKQKISDFFKGTKDRFKELLKSDKEEDIEF